MDFTYEHILLRYEDPGEFLLNELRKSYSDTCHLQHCDVKLLSKDKRVFNAHASLLAVVSPYMKSLLLEAWGSNEEIMIILPDFSGSDVKNLVEFLYTGKTSVTGKEFDTFQQMIVELQIITEGSRAIILEELSVIQNKETKETELEACTESLCSVCGILFTDNLRLNLIEKPAMCEICQEEAKLPDQLQTHITSEPDPLLKSDLCTAALKGYSIVSESRQFFKSKDQFDVAKEAAEEIIIGEVELILEEDTNPKKSKTLFHCKLCTSTFSSQSKLNEHMVRHSGIRPYKCPLCDKSYPIKATLTAHLRLHADDKPHQCERCGKAFLIRSLLEQHLRTHTDERPFSCQICGKAFRNQSNLIGHKKTHTGDRPHVCDVCQRSFNRKNDLDAHLRIHTGDKPFLCTLCRKSFRFRSALRVHLKGVHKANT